MIALVDNAILTGDGLLVLSLIRLAALSSGLIIYVSSGFFRDSAGRRGGGEVRVYIRARVHVRGWLFLLLIHDRRFDVERINQNDIILRIHQLAIMVIIANVCR